MRKEKIFTDDKCDILKVVFDPKTKKPQVAISEFLRIQWTVLDPEIQEDVKYLQNFSDGDLHFLDSSLDGQKWIIGYYYDNKPAHDYLYDRRKKNASFLLSANKELENFPLTNMHPLIITSRDGLPLVSYLSIPLQGPQS